MCEQLSNLYNKVEMSRLHLDGSLSIFDVFPRESS